MAGASSHDSELAAIAPRHDCIGRQQPMHKQMNSDEETGRTFTISTVSAKRATTATTPPSANELSAAIRTHHRALAETLDGR